MSTQKPTSSLRIVMHGFFLISLNLFSLMAAVLVAVFSGQHWDETLRLGLAFFINAMLYLLIFRLMSGLRSEVMHLDDFMMMSIILVASMALFPAVFFPLHYLTKGEWAIFEQILDIWPFQLLINGFCLVLNFYFLSRSNNS